MKHFGMIAVLTLTIVPSLLAQNNAGTLTVNVNPRDGQGESSQSTGPMKLLLDGRELPVLLEEDLPDAPLNVVFVLDNGGHQQGLMGLAKDYVVKLATAIHNSHPSYTILSAAREPKILVEANDASKLAAGLGTADSPSNLSQDASADLNAGIEQAAKLLGTMPGARAIVVFSDDDDDIAGKAMQNLKTLMAGAHIRCFSILLAQHDFFGTKARTAWGVRLNSLANFSGGAQYDTYWQSRRSDDVVLRTVAARISAGSLVSFIVPASLNMKPGTYFLKVQWNDGKPTIRTSPFILSP